MGWTGFLRLSGDLTATPSFVRHKGCRHGVRYGFVYVVAGVGMVVTQVNQPGSRLKGKPRELAIVAATLELLAELGYDRLTMDAVAARARASKATIYRRWPGKPELVTHAMRTRLAVDTFEMAETGDLRNDLLLLVRTIRDRFAASRNLMLGLVNAAEHDPELGSMLRAEFVPDGKRAGDLIARMAIAAGVSPPDLTIIQEIAQSAIGLRVLLTLQPTDEEYLGRLVDEVVLPLLTHTTGSGRNR